MKRLSPKRFFVTLIILVMIGIYAMSDKMLNVFHQGLFGGCQIEPTTVNTIRPDKNGYTPTQMDERNGLLRGQGQTAVHSSDFADNTIQRDTTLLDPIDDYHRYPCVEELYSRGTTPCVRTICTQTDCGLNDINCTALPIYLINNTTICTNNPDTDLISIKIKRYGNFEKGLVENMMKILELNPDMVLVDIGCNIGVFTLVAAWMSRRVVCVDANYKNIRLVHKTLDLANLTENVTLIWNSLSSERKEAKLLLNKVNVGASSILDERAPANALLFQRLSVQTVLLDDLQPLINDKPIFMKMDVERHEWKVLNGANRFLKTQDVRYIQMEFQPPNEVRANITRFLQGYDFLLFRDIDGEKRITLDDILAGRMSGHNVYFLKKKR